MKCQKANERERRTQGKQIKDYKGCQQCSDVLAPLSSFIFSFANTCGFVMMCTCVLAPIHSTLVFLAIANMSIKVGLG